MRGAFLLRPIRLDSQNSDPAFVGLARYPLQRGQKAGLMAQHQRSLANDGMEDDQGREQASHRDPGHHSVSDIDAAAGPRPSQEHEQQIQTEKARARSKSAEAGQLRE